MDTAEYERRRDFCTDMKKMTKPEFIEIARILRKNNIPLSENRSGIYFDFAKLPQDVFDQLIKFREFIHANSEELNKRDRVVKKLCC